MTTTADAPHSQVPVDVLAGQFLENIARGATIGDMLDFTQREYNVIYSIGHTLYVQHRFEDAARVFGFLVFHNHQERRYIKALASALHMSGNYGDAIRAYTLASMMDLTDPAPCLHTCECLIALGQNEAAAQGLAILARQCEGDSHAELRERAQAMLDLISQSAATAAPEETP